MVSSTITTPVSGNTVTIYVNISPADGVSNWGIYVYAHTDHGLGSGGSDPNYTYFVERINGTGTGTYAFDRTYSPDQYAAELALQGYGSVDASLFTISAGATVTAVTVTFDNLSQPQTGTVTVTGSGTGTYQLTEGTTVISTRTLNNGFDQFTLTSIPYGTHTYCAGSACDTFTVSQPLPNNKWSCSDNCATAKQTGEYNSQSACAAACAPTGCTQADNSLLLNLQSTSLTINTGDTVNVNVKMSSGKGKQWKLIRIIDPNSPAGDTVFTTGTLDSNGCGSSIVMFTSPGVYYLKGIWCDVWVGDNGAHCFSSEIITNTVILTAKTSPPPGTQGCTNCDLTKNICLMGNCVPKTYVLIGAGLFIAMMALK